MPTVISVKFTYAARDLWFDAGATGAQEGDHLICSTERGTEIGLATSEPREVSNAELGRMIGNATLKPVLRVATVADLDLADSLARKGEEAFPVFRQLVAQSGLDMKPVGVEYLFGGEKVVCYFAAEERVDFRQLVRDISHELHERIDMRQIGVREEAAVVGGYGHCGQELCCARFGLSFEPVSIRMAKEQDLPLTSNKISGACGRLMCCLRYEFEAYRDFKGRAPKRNAVIDTPLGKAKIVEYDTPKEEICMRIESGKVVRIPLAEMETSEAAVRKSEELHCPCRPDTVVRASLEKLSSPDVQMALAELDRKNGVLPDDTFDEADLFVETKPRKRRKRKGGQPQEQDAQATSSRGEQGQSSRRRRRRKKAAEAGKVKADNVESRSAAQASDADAAPEAPEKRTRRRRRRRAGSGGAGEQVAAAQASAKGDGAEQPKEGRRRRHHQASGANATATQQQGEKTQKRQRRRPGDRAGQKAQQQPKPQQQQAPADGAPKRRRRRRRSRKPGGGEGQSGS